MANYRCAFGVRFRGEFVSVMLAGLIGIGSRVFFDPRDESSRSITHFRRDALVRRIKL